MAQLQLLRIPLDPKDVVFTPDWVARDMVKLYNPTGIVLDPCTGDGIFLKYLPTGTHWCEITKGHDFYSWNDQVDWVIGNPPYRQFLKWMFHSMDIATNIAYLLPCDKPFISWKMITKMRTWGGLRSMRFYGQGRTLGFPIGFAVGSLHFQKNYFGPIELSYYDPTEDHYAVR